MGACFSLDALVELDDVAIRIADEEGIEELSMRRLGQEVGAGATSLYRHVSNKDELLDLALDQVASVVCYKSDLSLPADQIVDGLQLGPSCPDHLLKG